MEGSGALQPLCDGLTCLGNVPWAINKPLLEVMEAVFATGAPPVLVYMCGTRVHTHTCVRVRAYTWHDALQVLAARLRSLLLCGEL